MLQHRAVGVVALARGVCRNPQGEYETALFSGRTKKPPGHAGNVMLTSLTGGTSPPVAHRRAEVEYHRNAACGLDTMTVAGNHQIER